MYCSLQCSLRKQRPERYLECLKLLSSLPMNAMEKRGLSPIQLVAQHENWIEHALEASDIHLTFATSLKTEHFTCQKATRGGAAVCRPS